VGRLRASTGTVRAPARSPGATEAKRTIWYGCSSTPDPAVLPGFLAAVLVICLAPGPDMAFIVAASIGWGRGPG